MAILGQRAGRLELVTQLFQIEQRGKARENIILLKPLKHFLKIVLILAACVFVGARGLALVAERGGLLYLRGKGFSLQWLRLLRPGLCGKRASVISGLGFCCPRHVGILLEQGIKHVSPAFGGQFFTLGTTKEVTESLLFFCFYFSLCEGTCVSTSSNPVTAMLTTLLCLIPCLAPSS